MDRAIEVMLPGGIALKGGLERRACLRPLTGFIEERVIDATATASSTAAAVSEILGAAIERVGPCPGDRGLAADLSVADRQFLMLRLAAMTRGPQAWLQAACTSCTAPFDLCIDLGSIPVKPAGPGYPVAEVQLPRGVVRLRVPTGADQEAVCGLPEEEAEIRLRERCMLEDGGTGAAPAFEPWEIDAMESALEEASPQVATRLATLCPECTQEQVLQLQPYALLERSRGALLEDVHRLAACYHWSEDEILALPRSRRWEYLALIDRYRGLHS